MTSSACSSGLVGAIGLRTVVSLPFKMQLHVLTNLSGRGICRKGSNQLSDLECQRVPHAR